MSYPAFAFLSVLLIASALGVVLNRNPVRSAMNLVATLFLLAVAFVLLEAHLVAVLQVIVYAGAIMVLFLFVIMLLNLQREEPLQVAPVPAVAVVITAVGFVVLTALGVLRLRIAPAPLPEGFGGVASVSERLFTTYVLPFEMTGVLLLVAVIGAVVMARRPSRGRPSGE